MKYVETESFKEQKLVMISIRMKTMLVKAVLTLLESVMKTFMENQYVSVETAKLTFNLGMKPGKHVMTETWILMTDATFVKLEQVGTVLKTYANQFAEMDL